MIIPLLSGIFLGALSVLFVLQNVEVVTVTFMSWELTASLAILLFCALFMGILIMSLLLVPSLLRDGAYLSAIKRQKRELEDELATYKAAAASGTSSPEHSLQ